MMEATKPRHAVPVTVSRCPADGEIAVPAERFGCRRCGKEPSELDVSTVEPRGVVEVMVTVHRPIGGHKPPYFFGEIRLDAGPMLRGVCTDDFAPGTRVVAVDRDSSVVFAQEEDAVDA